MNKAKVVTPVGDFTYEVSVSFDRQDRSDFRLKILPEIKFQLFLVSNDIFL